MNNRDESVFQDLLHHYSPRVYTFALAYLKNEQKAAGIVLEIFDHLWKTWDSSPEATGFDKYLFTVTCDKVLNSLKYR